VPRNDLRREAGVMLGKDDDKRVVSQWIYLYLLMATFGFLLWLLSTLGITGITLREKAVLFLGFITGYLTSWLFRDDKDRMVK
jgi:hypothetical protein